MSKRFKNAEKFEKTSNVRHKELMRDLSADTDEADPPEGKIPCDLCQARECDWKRGKCGCACHTEGKIAPESIQAAPDHLGRGKGKMFPGGRAFEDEKGAPEPPSLRDPSPEELKSPVFEAVWKAIKGWDISRTSNGMYAGATGTDVCTILDAICEAGVSAVDERGGAEGSEPVAFMCPEGCGCLWRDNHDGTMSLFGPNSRSCPRCEIMPLKELTPLWKHADTQKAKLLETVRWIASQTSLFFAECSQAEEIVARCKEALVESPIVGTKEGAGGK